MSDLARRAVAIGGGTGLPNVLWCLLEMGLDTTAVVTMADDGGSSGHLRRELGMLPPGDARNCLRRDGGPRHAPRARLRIPLPPRRGSGGPRARQPRSSPRSPTSKGRSRRRWTRWASCSEREAASFPRRWTTSFSRLRTSTATRVVGQVNVAESAAPIDCVRFVGRGTAEAYRPAVEALREADLIVVGPGSLFTSLLPELPRARHRRRAQGVPRTSGLRVQRGQSARRDGRHGRRGPRRRAAAPRARRRLRCRARARLRRLSHLGGRANRYAAVADTVARMRALGIDVVLADLADPADPRHHSRERLLRALRDVTKA